MSKSFYLDADQTRAVPYSHPKAVKTEHIHDLYVYVLPVSGGRFTSQLALLSELYDANKLRNCKYKPDLVLSCSGGNVSAYLAMAAEWSSSGIRRLASKLQSDLFIKSWYPPPLRDIPDWIALPFKGSFFAASDKGSAFFKSLYTADKIQDVEIWTGTYDSTERKAQFFCNREHSILDVPHFNEQSFLYGSLPVIHLNGDIDSIATVCTASAAIPSLVPNQQLEGHEYSDGGVMYASPLVPLSTELYRLVNSGRRLRLTYFCSYHMDDSLPRYGIIKTAISQYLHAGMLEDRAAAVSLLYRISSNESDSIIYSNYHTMNTRRLSNLLAHLQVASIHYVIILYPHGSPKVKLRDFDGSHVLDKMHESLKNYGAYAWYLPSRCFG